MICLCDVLLFGSELFVSGTIAVRRETMNRWERRTPLTPTHVRKLVRDGYNVIIQPSKMRVFTDDQYAKAGAILKDDISPASVIMGVKEVPIHELIPNRTFAQRVIATP